jgi:NADH-quinone oxidoreductase subunit M
MTDILSLMIFIPLVGMAVVLCLPSRNHSLIAGRRSRSACRRCPRDRLLWTSSPTRRFQFVHHVPWIALFNIDYFVGVDGISIAMVVLTRSSASSA